MSINIIDLAKKYLTTDTVDKVSHELGESPSNVNNAISAYLPIILGTLVDKNSSTGGLLHTLKSFGASRGLNSLSTQTSESPVLSQLINLLFGSNQSGIVSKIAEFAGISNRSSSKLFNLVSEVSLGSLGKYANDNNLGEAEFGSLLNTNKSSLASLLPAGLGLGALGLGNIFGGDKSDVKTEIVRENLTVEKPKVETREHVRKVETKEEPYVDPVRNNEPEEKSSFWKWLIPLLLLLLGGYLIWNWLKKDDNQDTTPVTTTDTVRVQEGDTTEVVTTKTYSDIDLDGVTLKAYPGGFEEQIITYIKSDEYKNASEDQLKEKWFNFDNINFVFGKTDQLEGDSNIQLENLAQILKKYPDTKIKIGAYTDNVGKPEDNKVLSQKRADFLKSELSRLGVGAQVIGAEGYGAEFATVPAEASDEERSADRKMSIRFSK